VTTDEKSSSSAGMNGVAHMTQPGAWWLIYMEWSHGRFLTRHDSHGASWNLQGSGSCAHHEWWSVTISWLLIL
jgi:hypothetical protein